MLEDAQKAMANQEEILYAATAAPISVTYSSAVGLAMVFVSALIAIINISVIKALLSAKELYRLSSYKFIIGIGVSSVFQMFAEFVAGILTISRTNGATLFNRFISAIIVSGYTYYLLLTLVLALNRLSIIISPFVERLLFSKVAVRVWLTICTLIAIIDGALLMSPWMGNFYDWHILSFDYIFALPGSYSFQYYKTKMERWGSYAVACIYLANFVIIRAKRRPKSEDERKSSTGNGTVDRKLLIQSFAITADCLIINVFWYYSKDLLPVVFPNTVGSLVFLNFLWIFSCAVNPIVYFFLNK